MFSRFDTLKIMAAETLMVFFEKDFETSLKNNFNLIFLVSFCKLKSNLVIYEL